MKAKLKKQWIMAMESGKYVHGRGFLHLDDTFDPLGVLCDLYRMCGKGEWIWTANHISARFFKYMGDRAGHYLPDTLAQELRLPYTIQRRLSLIHDASEDFNPAIQFIATQL